MRPASGRWPTSSRSASPTATTWSMTCRPFSRTRRTFSRASWQIQVADRAVVVARVGAGAQQLVEEVEPAAVGPPLEVGRAVRNDRGYLGFGQLIKSLGAQRLQGGEPALVAGEQPAVLEELVG